MKHIILLPTYNESENIEKIISVIFGLQPDIYIKVIDDNSPDGTGKIVASLLGKFPNLSLLSRKGKEGLGKAYINGFREVIKTEESANIIMMDADLSHNPKYLGEMIRLSNDYDLVIGSRYIAGGGTEGWETWRKMLSFFGNMYARFIMNIPVKDMTGGFNCINIKYLKKLNFDSIDASGYAFIMELKYSLYKKGIFIKEFPIVFTNRIGGESKISNHIISEGILAPWRMRLKKNDEKIICPLCNRKSATIFNKKSWFVLYKCRECKFLFVHPLPKSNDVYGESYFSGAKDGFGYVDYDADKEPMIPTFEKYLDIMSSLGFSSGKLLDFGAATGFFMKIAQKRGFETVGLEVSKFAAKKGQDQGLDILTDDAEIDNFPAGHFDVITMFDVLEHMPDPKDTLARLSRVLKPGGLLVINTPDAESLWAKILGSRWQLILPPEHLHYFSPKNLSEYMKTRGFSVEVNAKIGKRFTFQYIFETLRKWQGSFWEIFVKFFSKGFLSKLYLPINLRDNFFMILRKE